MTLTTAIALDTVLDVAVLGALAYAVRIPFPLDRTQPPPGDGELPLELAA